MSDRTLYGLDEWFWAIFAPTRLNFTFGQLFMWIGANNDQIRLPLGRWVILSNVRTDLNLTDLHFWSTFHVLFLFCCWSLTSLCHSNGHIETMPAREINPFTALTRIRYQFLRTQWSTSNHQRVDTTTPQTAQPSGLASTFHVNWGK